MKNTSTQNDENKPERQLTDSSDHKKLQGKSLQVNDNSVEDKGSPKAVAPRQSDEKPNRDTLEGKAFKVNKNSVEDKKR